MIRLGMAIGGGPNGEHSATTTTSARNHRWLFWLEHKVNAPEFAGLELVLGTHGFSNLIPDTGLKGRGELYAVLQAARGKAEACETHQERTED